MGVIDLWQELVARRERLARRPVVLAHEVAGRDFQERGPGFVVIAAVENHSDVAAHNVRFGVELHGVAIPFRGAASDASPSRLNVVAARQRVPDTEGFVVVIPDGFGWDTAEDPDPGRAYWCLYQDPGGHWWETRNPVRRDGDFTIRRVRSGKRRLRKLTEAFQEKTEAGEAAAEEARGELLSRLSRRGD